MASQILVAGDGVSAQDGLHLFCEGDDGWSHKLLAAVEHLVALALHPSLDIVYGVAGGEGRLYTWTSGGHRLSEMSTGGVDPCHVSVDPNGAAVVVVNYTSGSLARWALDGSGRPVGDRLLVVLEGHGPDSERQEAAHPHQAVFVGTEIIVTDLGSDRLRIFDRELRAVRSEHLPPGTGPRHLVVLDDGRSAVTGELSSSVLVGGVRVDSTAHTGPARTRGPRNYPGDIALAVNGHHVYVANRGFDTIASFDVADEPERIGEVYAGVAWPQHLLVEESRLLVAGWDSGRVVAIAVDGDGGMGEATPLFECPGARWLLAVRGCGQRPEGEAQ